MTGLAVVAPAILHAQGGKLAAAAPVTYDNRYEVYGGINYMNFQAGQDVAHLMNLGGAEFSGTYWLSDRWGAVADYRGEAGTTKVNPNLIFNGYALVVLNTGMVGAQYRSIHTQRAALDFHALAGVSRGWFNETLPSIGTGMAASNTNSGLYNNKTKPMAALGGSVDFNRSKNLAIRLSPDLILEHFGTETREFLSVSAGVIYRFGQR